MDDNRVSVLEQKVGRVAAQVEALIAQSEQDHQRMDDAAKARQATRAQVVTVENNRVASSNAAATQRSGLLARMERAETALDTLDRYKGVVDRVDREANLARRYREDVHGDMLKRVDLMAGVVQRLDKAQALQEKSDNAAMERSRANRSSLMGLERMMEDVSDGLAAASDAVIALGERVDELEELRGVMSGPSHAQEVAGRAIVAVARNVDPLSNWSKRLVDGYACLTEALAPADEPPGSASEAQDTVDEGVLAELQMHYARQLLDRLKMAAGVDTWHEAVAWAEDGALKAAPAPQDGFVDSPPIEKNKGGKS